MLEAGPRLAPRVPDALQPLLAAGSLLVACDFDGTISRLVSDPWAARIIPSAQRSLRRLASSPDTHVALISGRGVADLASRTRIGGVSYLGDHGAERAEARRGFRPAALRPRREAAPPGAAAMAAQLASLVPEAVDDPWLVVERKGASVTFHFRAAPDVDAAHARVLAAVAAIDPDAMLRRSGGRRAIELRPAGASTKGDALAALIEERSPDAVVMLGDDRNDALAFDTLRAARAAGRIDGLAIAVAGHPDVSADVGPRADLVLDSPGHAARLLRVLARARSGATSS